MAAEQETTDTRTNAQSARLESEYTPGPWKAAGDLDGIREDYREDRCIITEDFDEENRTGSIIGVLRGHGPELRANARLIAAAPDMLDALKCLLGAYDDLESGNTVTAFRTLADARAAIAKAEGTARQ